MNGTNDSSDLCRNNNIGNCRTGNRSGGDNLNDRNEATEYERRRKIVEEAKKLILNAQKV